MKLNPYPYCGAEITNHKTKDVDGTEYISFTCSGQRTPFCISQWFELLTNSKEYLFEKWNESVPKKPIIK